MVNLEPIKKKIQQRLLQKQRLLGTKNREIQSGVNQPTVNNSIPRLTYDKLATRTPFLRMTSGIEQPIILMGGELEDDGSVVSGYEDMYGPRRLDVYEDGELIGAGDTANSFRRPLPGVKSVEAQFQGGLKASRKATVNWSCWSFEDITRLTPHFLQHGHSVLVEWGWVYDKESLSRMPNFIQELGFEGGKIKPEVFKDYQTKIVDNYGDIDVMAGVISNYEYSTRQDGGFDCTTTITSLGVNMFDREEEESDVVDTSIIFNLSEDDNEETRNEKIKNIDSLIDYDTNTTFKAFLLNINDYFDSKVLPNMSERKILKKTLNFNSSTVSYIRSKKNKFIIVSSESVTGTGGEFPAILSEQVEDVWVRWGWFEDNVLSKFTSITNKDGEPLCVFRSVDNFDESEKIRNHKDLETFNFKKYILPGQFKPIDVQPVSSTRIPKPIIKADDDYVRGLKTAVDDNFDKFQVDGDISQGFLRNMLINTKLIQEAFGVSGIKINDKTSFPAGTMNQGIKTLFDRINSVGNFNYWNFQLKENEDGGEIIKIVDDNIVDIDFNRPLKQQRTTVDGNGELISEGVFFFPVWEKDSLVKNQNLQAKIPSSLQIATMYGANTPELKEILGKSANHASTGVIAGRLSGNQVDPKYQGADIAIRNKESQNIGSRGDDFVSNNGDSSIFDYINDNTVKKQLSTNYGVKLKEEEKQNFIEQNNHLLKKLKENKKYKKTQPLPLPSDLSTTDLESLFDEQTYFNAYNELAVTPELDPNFIGPLPAGNEFELKVRQNKIKQFLKEKRREFETLYAGKYTQETGEMKSDFQDTIKQKVQYFGEYSDDKIPVLVPFELELEIDGIGGIYPGNSFHSTYLPQNYKDSTVFQAVNVNHTVNESGWTTTLVGKMRTTLNQLAQKFQQQDLKITVEVARNLFEKEALTRAAQISIEDMQDEVKRLKSQQTFSKNVDIASKNRGGGPI